MRATQSDQTGNIGETEVTGKFERLGWGVAPNPRHDVGTDLWLMARDSRLYDLGLVVGAQVKTGPSFFAETERDASGTVIGWWFRDADRKHVDAWLAHGLPHLIVLHDLDTQTSYWAHVSAEAVLSTGKGAKVLVPAANTVDDAHRDDLLRVAASKRSGGTWEGSAWSGDRSVPATALLRHALIVPRLIAPHPNADREQPITPAQALALLVQGRLADLTRRSEQHAEVPSWEEATGSINWDWRFVGAMGTRVMSEDFEPLALAARDAPDPARRTAATVAAAASMLEQGLADRALTVLEEALRRDDADPVDHAWLTIQKARAYAEIGEPKEARDIAARAQAIGSTHAEDVTATALAGVAALLLFNNSGSLQSDVSAVIAGSDTTATWWRTQTVSRGLTALTRRTFWTWARDDTVRITTGDEANDQLLSAALTASYAGDHATWRHLSGLLAQDGLLRLGRDAASEAAKAALETLRLAGNANEMQHAVRRLGDDGPSAAVTEAAAHVELDQATRTTAPATLTLLERGGDLLDQATADRTIGWLLSTLDDSTEFEQRTQPTYLVDLRLVDVIARVVPAASPEIQRIVAERIATLPPQTDQLLATSWARAEHALPRTVWSEEAATTAGVAASGHHGVLATSLLGVAALYNEDVRQRLLDMAAGGDLDALGALGDVTHLPDHVVRVVVSASSVNVRREVELAEQGVFRAMVHDDGHILALLNIWHPALADWPPLLELIAHPLVAGSHKSRACQLLATNPDRVPAEIRGGLLAAARSAASHPPLPSPFSGLHGGPGGGVGPVNELVAALATEEDPPGPDQLPALLAGDHHARQSAARIARRLRRPEDIGVLLVLATDHDPHVRTAAARGLAELLADGEGDQTVISAVRRCANDTGRLVPTAVAIALSRRPTPGAEATALLNRLRQHRSASVRRAAATPPDLPDH
ncbi:DUF4365 domain-containing protein [Geodermatophilus sp. SYSU D00525]